jgi:hypothetical protein
MTGLIKVIESCNFECEAGPLTMSRDWQALKARVAELEEMVTVAKQYINLDRAMRIYRTEQASAKTVN